MKHENEYSAECDLNTLKEAEEIRNSPERLTAIRKVAEEKRILAETLTKPKKTTTEDDFIKKGFTVV